MHRLLFGLATANLALAQTLALINGTVVDGVGPARSGETILVENGRITAVGPNLRVPSGITTINLEGRVVTPGLFDLHTHLPYSSVSGGRADWGKQIKAYLYSGVTSVVDFGSYFEMFEPMRRLTSTGVIEGPRLTLASRITTPGGHGAEGGRGDFFSVEVLTPKQARAAVKKLAPSRPDVIKVFTDGWRYGAAADMTSMEEETLKAICEEAHKIGIKVLTHTVTLEKAKIAIRAGVDALVHGIGDKPVDDEFIQLIKASGTVYTPTLAVYEPRRSLDWDANLEAVLEGPSKEILRAMNRSGVISKARAERWKTMQANVAALYQAGIPIGVGTDAGVTGTYHGWATLRELKLLAATGVPMAAVLQSATSIPAKLLNLDRERGSVEPGKLADLVVFDKSPFDDPQNVDTVARVFKGGVEVNRPQLAKDIASPEITPMPSKPAQRKIDDFERNDGRTAIGTLRVNTTDPGHDHALMMFERTLRAPGNHAMTVLSKMTESQRPYIRLDLPLTPGAIEPADVSQFRGITFAARGEEDYLLIVTTRTGRFEARFTASAKWTTVRIPFTQLVGKGPWTGKDATMVSLEVRRPEGEEAWFEVDDVTFY